MSSTLDEQIAAVRRVWANKKNGLAEVRRRQKLAVVREERDIEVLNDACETLMAYKAILDKARDDVMQADYEARSNDKP